jgi:GTP-binding protein HflX
VEQQLENVRRTRRQQRQRRESAPVATVALVGYTNAGKSTLFNRMTRASVVSADMLFATLDPTLRAVDLPHGTRMILSDTVGFISDLPTMLVAAFRATLEEVIEADLILHVRDVSHGDTDAQSKDVADVLDELGIAPEDERLVEVWNKIDRVDAEERQRLDNLGQRQPADRQPALVSAVTGEGIDRLVDQIEGRLARTRVVMELDVDPGDGAAASWLYRNVEVLDKTLTDAGRFSMTVRVDPTKVAMVRAKYAAVGGANLP